MGEVELLKLVSNGGSAVAVIVVVVMFLRFIAKERDAQSEERKGFWSAMERLTAAINTLSTKLDLLERKG